MKPITTLLADAERAIAEVKERMSGYRPLNQSHTIQTLLEENKRLKTALIASNKSKGQYKGMYERKQKQCLRLEAEKRNLERENAQLDMNLIACKQDLKVMEKMLDGYGDSMGHNFITGCHRCKEQQFHFRGQENLTMRRFYYNHEECIRLDVNNVVTVLDNMGNSPDWIVPESDGGYKEVDEPKERPCEHLITHTDAFTGKVFCLGCMQHI